MSSLKDIMARFNRGPNDIVGLELSDSGIAAVRMRKTESQITVLAADLLPAPGWNVTDAEGLKDVTPLELPARLKAKYVTVTVPGRDAVIKLLSFPGQFNEQAEAKIVSNMGLDKPDSFRISYLLVSEGHGRTESRVLAVALPEHMATLVVRMFPVGIPAPLSLEVSGLAAMTGFLHGPGKEFEGNAVAAVHFGNDVTTFALFNRGVLAMIRRLDFGTHTVLEQIQNSLGVDRETATGIMTDGAFDISQSVTSVMEHLVKQLIVSRDFVERRENCHINHLFVSGGLMASRDCLQEMRAALGLEPQGWAPLNGLSVQAGAVNEKLAAQEWKFTACVGSILGGFEAHESPR